MTMRYFVIVVALTSLIACGGGSASPVSPSPQPTPTPAPPPPPPFQGVWVGQWTKQQCSEIGSGAAGACAQLPTGGGLTITLTQSGSTASGTVSVGVFQVQVSGPVSPAQELQLTGQGRQSSTTVTIGSWRTALDGNLMVGSFIYAIAPDDVRLGGVQITAGLQSVVKQN